MLLMVYIYCLTALNVRSQSKVPTGVRSLSGYEDCVLALSSFLKFGWRTSTSHGWQVKHCHLFFISTYFVLSMYMPLSQSSALYNHQSWWITACTRTSFQTKLRKHSVRKCHILRYLELGLQHMHEAQLIPNV